MKTKGNLAISQHYSPSKIQAPCTIQMTPFYSLPPPLTISIKNLNQVNNNTFYIKIQMKNGAAN